MNTACTVLAAMYIAGIPIGFYKLWLVLKNEESYNSQFTDFLTIAIMSLVWPLWIRDLL